MKERLRIQGLRKRWILNSVGPVILILVLAAILASATVANNYYGSARSTLEAKAKAGADYFNSYSMSSYSEYYRNASLYAASFDSTRIELQFLNLYGRVDNSTQGVAAGTAPQTPELARALESGSIEVFSGKDPVTGESVMAVTTPLKFNGSTVAFMRYVTATRQIDHQILLTILIISAIIAGVICLVLISSLLFINSVVAPVMLATSGSRLISEEAVEALKSQLLPLAAVLTPNIPEAEVLSGLSIQDEQGMEEAARIIGDSCGCAVLCKGGHAIQDADDVLYNRGQLRWFRGERIDNPNTHGTGCTLSSAIAANLALGLPLEESVARAKDYLSGALRAMLDLGAGSGPLNHTYPLTEH